jgi:hypothetical protein
VSWMTVDAGGKTEFHPGETLAGSASWSLDAAPGAVEIRLFWYTEGRGTQDVGLVEKARFEQPQPSERREFQFTLPDRPYSLSGKLISVRWAVEVVAEPSGEAQRFGFTLGSNGKEILLGEPAGP